MSIQPAQYYRNSKDWHKLLGHNGVVLFSTQVEVSSPELEAYLPYCFLIVELNSGKKIEVMGEAKTLFEPGNRIVLELRKAGTTNSSSIIPYILKAVKQV